MSVIISLFCSLPSSKEKVTGLTYLQEELNGLASSYPDSFKVYYVLNEVFLTFLFLMSLNFVFFLLFVKSSCLTFNISFESAIN